MANFNLNGTLSGITNVLGGLTIRAIGKKGTILDSVSLSNSGDYSLNFDSDSLLKNKKGKTKNKGKFTLELVDGNGDAANFTMNDGSAGDLFPNTQSQKIKFSKDASSLRFDMSPTGNPVNPDPDFGSVELTQFADIYAIGQGGTVFTPGDFTSNGFLMTNERQLITGPSGSLGGGNDNPYADNRRDSITDPSTTDNDEIRVESNNQHRLSESLDTVVNITNVETLKNTGFNDDSSYADFNLVRGLKNLTLDGTYTDQINLINYLDSGARNFDFSGMNSGGVEMTDSKNFVFGSTFDKLTIKGSKAPDYIEGSLGDLDLRAGAGADEIYGSQQGASYIAGDGAKDDITLVDTNNKQDTISLVTIDSENDGDNITGFIPGIVANVLGQAADLLEFDIDTFSNYTRGTNATPKFAAEAQAAADIGQGLNFFVKDELANIQNLDASNTGRGWLAVATDTNELYFAPTGDFAGDSRVIATFNGWNLNNNFNGDFGEFFLPNTQAVFI